MLLFPAEGKWAFWPAFKNHFGVFRRGRDASPKSALKIALEIALETALEIVLETALESELAASLICIGNCVGKCVGNCFLGVAGMAFLGSHGALGECRM